MQDDNKKVDDAIKELSEVEVNELEDEDLEDVAGGLAALDDDENCNNTNCCN